MVGFSLPTLAACSPSYRIRQLHRSRLRVRLEQKRKPKAQRSVTMAPNPIMLPKRRTRQSRHSLGVTEDVDTENLGLTWPLITSACVVLLLALSKWAFRWVLSGCAIETLVILFGAGYGSRLFPAVPLWTVLTTLNLFYAVASTSWLLYGVFGEATSAGA